MDLHQPELEPIAKQLQREFIRRCKKNGSYSLRAYAQFLEVDQSFLSKILNGKRQVTPAMATKFAAKLGWTATSLWPKKRPSNMPDHFIDLKDDEYETISNWYHFAILELLKTQNFSPSFSKIAKQLGLHAEEVKDAVERLARLGFVKITDKRWVLVSKNHKWIKSEYTTAGRTKMQIDLTQKSLRALEEVPFAQREHGSLTVALDSRKLPEFKKRISEVIMEFSDLLQPDTKNLDSVYQLTIALFPLSKIDPKGDLK